MQGKLAVLPNCSMQKTSMVTTADELASNL